MGLQPTGNLQQQAPDLRRQATAPDTGGISPLLWGTVLIAALTILLIWQLSR